MNVKIQYKYFYEYFCEESDECQLITVHCGPVNTHNGTSKKFTGFSCQNQNHCSNCERCPGLEEVKHVYRITD